MRCIETVSHSTGRRLQQRLIVTWDVLKLHQDDPHRTGSQINSNMRCIETNSFPGRDRTLTQINSNMRCIETRLCQFYPGRKGRLIVTWDVLKQKQTARRMIRNVKINSNMRCIETICRRRNSSALAINSNMRCIETPHTCREDYPAGEINSNMRCIETS